MNSVSDQQLLVDYTERHTEAAFAELVRRHVDLVHSAALRMVRDAQLAEDVTQGAFIALAGNAARLAERPVLSGWLHGTARNLAANAIRSDVRRRACEEEAAAMNELLSATPDAPWEEIAPHLDAALAELSETDRDAVMLRYFEKKSAQEMAAVLNVSTDAAQKRVNRAVERLREVFAKRGVSVSAGSLVLLLSANAVQAAPVGLVATISAAAAVAGNVTSTTAAVTATTSITTATKALAMTALQKTIVTATVVVLAGAGIYEGQQAAHLRDQVSTLELQRAPLTQQIQQLQRERDEAQTQLASLRVEKMPLPDNSAELLRLRGMAGVARRALAEADQLRAQLAKQASEAANNPVANAMADAMKEAMEHQFEGRLSRMTATLRLTPEQAQAAREILMRQARAISAGMQQGMSGKFDKEEINRLAKEAGNPDEQIKALLTPEQQASFPTYKDQEASHTAGLAANQELVQLQTSLELTAEQLDPVYAALYGVSYRQLTGADTPKNVAGEGEAMQWALEQKTKALEPLLTEPQIERYREQQARQAKLVKDLMNRMGKAGDGK